jgi:hypothetical protein
VKNVYSTDTTYGVLEKNGDQLDQSFRKLSITYSQGGQEYPIYDKKKAKWIGHSLRRNGHLKHVIEGKIEEGSDTKTRKKT